MSALLAREKPVIRRPRFRGGGSDLAQEAELVPTVPTPDDASVYRLNDHYSRHPHRMAGRFHAESFAKVRTGERQARHCLVAFDNDVLYSDLNVRNSAAHIAKELFEFGRAMNVLLGFAESVCYGVGRHQLVHRLLAALVPNFIEPTAHVGFQLLLHLGDFITHERHLWHTS